MTTISSPAVLATPLEEQLSNAEARYRLANPNSAQRYQHACKVMPGGNTRSALHFNPFPLTMVNGEGAILQDLDGHRYTDFIGDYTASLFGHSHPVLRDAMRNALDAGMTLGAPNRFDATLANLICERFASVEQLRFTNSGTEANLMALTAARAYTGRDKVLVFRGGYHGGVLLFGDKPSVHNAPYPFEMANYNDTVDTLNAIATHADSLAAVLIEPMLGTGGAIAATYEFLAMLRAQCSEHDIVLIFDEVMTSRLSAGGVQELSGITPDMTTFGKYLGGGGSFGAFGGATQIMKRFDPREPNCISHAGTFNNNVLTMAGGVAALSEVYTAETARAHTVRGDAFKRDVNAAVARHNFPLQITGVGSILHLHWQRGPIASPADLKPANPALAPLLHLLMLERGFYFSQKGFITLSLPLTESDYAKFLTALEDCLDQMASD